MAVEYFDVVIVGAGIAGSSVAFNLKKEMPFLKVLLIDEKEIGANKSYGVRNTTEDIIKEYRIPFIKTYKGINVGAGNETLFRFDKKFYLFDYQDCCRSFVEKSQVEFRMESAIALGKTRLKTNKSIYSFKYLIDCSGHNFFARKKSRFLR